METQIVAATIAVLTGLMGLGIFLAYRAYSNGSKQPQAPPKPSTITAKIDTAKPRPPKVVRAPEGCKKWFTAGKDYTVTSIVRYNPDTGYEFYCIDDVGDEINCYEKTSNHLNGGDWIIVEREGEEKQQPSIEQQLFEAQAEATRLAGELEKYKALLNFTTETSKTKEQEFDRTLTRAVSERVRAEQDRDEARALANDLRGCLDEALDKLKAVQADVQRTEKLLRDNGLLTDGKHTLRDQRGRFVKVAEAHVKINTPQPVKPLRLVTDLGENECIHCPTEREAEAICKLMHEAGLEWTDGCSYLKVICWSENKYKTCYIPKNGTYSSIDFHKYDGLTIHPASDFLPPEFYAEEQQPATRDTAIDWSKPVAFPAGYEIPKGTRVIYIGISGNVSRKGITIEKNQFPLVKWDEGYVGNHRGNALAPENPDDHPWHPEFKGNGNSLP